MIHMFANTFVHFTFIQTTKNILGDDARCGMKRGGCVTSSTDTVAPLGRLEHKGKGKISFFPKETSSLLLIHTGYGGGCGPAASARWTD